ncbi:hypothetical protein GCM10010124_41400 [Pilimelia terevasa]|uniref:Uncharacterized protein n=1 Tax=Pilimelia terevasa TaxID=53372 RepID=A0A8J3FLL3_9ACTN|nr:hypothetical protein [Pilimelia terevasa]GGK44272.1 hypothetical protein GCM10010124_41400 [Pilimelia terevasa]
MRKKSKVALSALVGLASIFSLGVSPAVAQPVDQGHYAVTSAAFESSLTLDGKVVDAATFAAMVRNNSTDTPAVKGDTDYGKHSFTPQRPHWRFGDDNGDGEQQIGYDVPAKISEQWKYQLSGGLAGVIVGNVNQVADLYCSGAHRIHYGPHSVSPYYLFHGSSKGPHITNQCHELRNEQSYKFRHKIGPGGNGELKAKWKYVITWVK